MTIIRAFPALFEGAISFDHSTNGLQPVRLPADSISLFPSPDGRLTGRAHSASGVRLRFATDSKQLTLVVAPLDTAAEPRFVDLTVNGEILISRAIPSAADSVELDVREASERSAAAVKGDRDDRARMPVYELWLHQFHPTRVAAIGIDDGAGFAIPDDARLRWVTYGSSITMCRGAASPARTWPAVAARMHRLNMTSLGFGGECHLDPMVARLIRDIPADIITLELGINVYASASLNARTYPAAVIGLVSIIRERHPTTPIGLLTAIHCPEWERTPNAVGCTLEGYRAMTRDAVWRLQNAGDERIVLFEGTELLGEGEAHLLSDGLHPNAEGYELMGQRVGDVIVPRLLTMRL